MSLRTLIVDDERFAREKIRAFLADYADFEVIAECEDGEQAANIIVGQYPAVVFLDVEIPGPNGLELLKTLPRNAQPIVVVVTAFDKYAVRAFDLEALDYLLKPFSKARFAQTICRIRQRTVLAGEAERNEALTGAIQQFQREAQDYERIAVKSGSRIILVRSDSTEWIEAQGDYVMIHAGKKAHLVRETMSAIEKRLDPRRFVRIHRSTIVNLDFVRELRPLWSGDYHVYLDDGTHLTLSRKYRLALRHKLSSSHP